MKTWIIRILCAIVIIIGICLLMLSTMGGNSEYHRQGLEQAFSESLKAQVTIGTLEEFNVFPQLAVQVKDIHGVFKDTKDEFMADKIRIAFGFSDLAMGRSRIEDFQLDNLRFSADSKYDLRIDQAGITKASAFAGKGRLSGRGFDFTLPLVREEGVRNAYHFGDKNQFSGHYGTLDFKGDIMASTEKNARIMENIDISSGGKTVATGQGIRDNGKIEIDIECSAKPAPEISAELAALKILSFIKLSENCGP